MGYFRIPLHPASACQSWYSEELYLSPDVLIARRTDERKTNQENIGLGVRKRTESVVIFLACRVPQTERDGLSIYHDICGIVIEHCVRLSERQWSEYSRWQHTGGYVFSLSVDFYERRWIHVTRSTYWESIGCIRDEKACLTGVNCINDIYQTTVHII